MSKLQYKHPYTGNWCDSAWSATELDRAEQSTGFLYRVVEDPNFALTPLAVAKQPHYTSYKPEPITVIEGWNLNFYRANAIKYIARAGRKDTTVPGTIKDLEKAISYLKRECNALRGTPSWD